MGRPVEGVVLSDRIPLEKWDKDNYVQFQRPLRKEAEFLAELQAQSVLEWDTDTQGRVSQRERVPLALLESAMVSMCLVDSDLVRGDDEDPIFVPGKTCRAGGKGHPDRIGKAFTVQWGMLPDELCEEIVDLLREWHPPFNWRADESD